MSHRNNLVQSSQDLLFNSAQQSLASGVSASMRLNPYLDSPLYVARGDGPYLYDLNGKRYIDLNMSNGAAMLGHNHPAVKAAVIEGVELGIICAAETPFHAELARQIVEIVPAAERVRFSSVGSEVTLVALRIARHATGRSRYLKFDGHFHGLTEPWLYKHADPLDSDSPIVPSSGGIPEHDAELVEMIPWNDVAAFERVMDSIGDELAAVICEPMHFNAGCIPAEPGFLQLLRDRTEQHGTILIFDEVLSGFRTALGGVQAESGVTPDLTTHAKALANGLPLASVSGREDLMLLLAPTGTVVHSGTYSGHLLSVLAALATLNELRTPGLYDQLNATADNFYGQLQDVFDQAGIPARVQGRGTRFGIYFGITDQVRTWADALNHDHHLNRQFTAGMFERGVYIHGYTKSGPPGHAGFSTAHSTEDFDVILNAAADVSEIDAPRSRQELEMKFVVGGIVHETHTFASVEAAFDDFHPARGDELWRWAGTNHSLGGTLDACRELGIEVAPTLFANATPSGPPSQITFELLLAELVERVSACLPADGVVLNLHGAMVAIRYPDAEAEIAQRVRAAIGPDTPIAVTLDLHANIGQAMVDAVNIITTYDTYPHIDAGDRGREAVELLHRTVLGEINPTIAMVKPPLMPVPQAQFTSVHPFSTIYERAFEIEKSPDVLTVSVAPGFAYSDVPAAGTSLLVITDNNPELARTMAAESGRTRLVTSQSNAHRKR